MGSVVLFDAERMQAIEDGTVTTGLVDANGDLILERHDGTQVNAGHVKGADGDDANVPDATYTVKGKARRATVLEAQGDTEAEAFLTPFTLATRTATAARRGLSFAATPLQTIQGIANDSHVTPEGLRAAREFYTAVVAGSYNAGTVTVTLDDTSIVPISGVMTDDPIRAGDSVYVQRVMNGNYYITGKYASLAQGGYANFASSTNLVPWDPRGWQHYEPARETGKRLKPTLPYVVHRSKSGVVTFSGLGRNKLAVAANTLIGTVPMGFRPSVYHRFRCGAGGAIANVEVRPDGQVWLLTAISAGMYLHLSNIKYHAAGQDLTWTSVPSFLSDFSASNVGTFGNTAYAQDTYGDVWLRGLITKATTTALDNFGIFDLPVGMRPTKAHHLNGYQNSASYRFFGVDGGTGRVTAKNGFAAGNSGCLSGIVVSPTADDALWSLVGNVDAPLGQMPVNNNWVDYDGGVTFTQEAIKWRDDGLVLSRGLSRSGNMGMDITKVPPGCWPMGRHRFEVPSNAATGVMDIVPQTLTGVADQSGMIVAAGGSNTWFSLDGQVWQSYY